MNEEASFQSFIACHVYSTTRGHETRTEKAKGEKEGYGVQGRRRGREWRERKRKTMRREERGRKKREKEKKREERRK